MVRSSEVKNPCTIVHPAVACNPASASGAIRSNTFHRYPPVLPCVTFADYFGIALRRVWKPGAALLDLSSIIRRFAWFAISTHLGEELRMIDFVLTFLPGASKNFRYLGLFRTRVVLP